MCLAHGHTNHCTGEKGANRARRLEVQRAFGGGRGGQGLGGPQKAELGPDGQVTSQLLRKETRLSSLLGTGRGADARPSVDTGSKASVVLAACLPLYLDPGARKRPLTRD